MKNNKNKKNNKTSNNNYHKKIKMLRVNKLNPNK